MEAIDGDELLPISEELLNPFQQLSLNPTLAQLLNEDFVVHFIKCLGKVKVDDVVLVAIQEAFDDVVYMLEQVSEAASALAEPMLLVAEKVIRLEVVYKFLSDNSLEDLNEVGSE